MTDPTPAQAPAPTPDLVPFRLGAHQLRLAGSDDVDAINRLNYRTFVQELGQYPDDGSGLRVDKFHAKNRYLLCERGGELVGMVAVHDRPPFSVSTRLPGGKRVEDLSERPLEVRLLAVRPDLRGGPVAFALLYGILRYCRENGYDDLWISGVTGQLRMYKRIGFRTLGPSVPQGEAAFAPMRLRVSELPDDKLRLVEAALRRQAGNEALTGERPLQAWLPGPPRIPACVAAALRRPPLYHREASFLDAFREVREALSDWMCGMRIAPFSGNGTLANDALACLIARLPALRGGRGLILANGEFGERLAGHARAAGLDFDVLRFAWGRAWDLQETLGRLDAGAHPWVWGVHLETSTGVLNPAQELSEALRPRGARLFLDTVSAIGAVPLPIGTAAATGVSGKALGALAGLCWVGASEEIVAAAEQRDWPPGLDLPDQWRSAGPCHTVPSPQLLALQATLRDWAPPERRAIRYARYAELGRRVREGLRAAGLPPLVPDGQASPCVTTFAVAEGDSTEAFLARMRNAGHQLAGASSYLRERDWAQIATLGEVRDEDLDALFDSLA